MSPAKGTFSIWGIIYLWQFVWLCYAVSLTRRRSIPGDLAGTPLLLPTGIFPIYLVSAAAGVVWLLLFVRELLTPALPVIATMPLTLYICMYLCCKSLAQHADVLYRSGRGIEVWKTYFLVHNGIGVYATWVTIATTLYLGLCLTHSLYGPRLSQEDSSTIALVLLGIKLLLWFYLDIFKLDRFVRYLWVPYFVFIWALIGVMVKSDGRLPGERNFLLTSLLLVASVAGAVTKVTVMIWKHATMPLCRNLNVPASKCEKLD